MIERREAAWARIVRGYLTAAMVVSAIVYAGYLPIRAMALRFAAETGKGQPAPGFPWPGLGDAIADFGQLALVVVVAGLPGILLFALTVCRARGCRWSAYMLVGALNGMGAAFVLGGLRAGPAAGEVTALAILLMLPGAFGGIVFWLVAGRPATGARDLS